VLIAAVGVSGSGKTTTLEFLISNLTKLGYDVGTIKHIHRENFTIDKEGTNTWRFSKAGSRIAVAFSPEEIAIIERTKTSLNDLDRVVKYLENEGVDVIFIEGFHGYISKRPDILKIITAKTVEDLDKTLGNTIPPVLAITGIIEKSAAELHDIPYVDLPNQGATLLEIVKKHLVTTQNR
jgi:molybdopterin-guanine dinucleotide biosynthesis adapter protein